MPTPQRSFWFADLRFHPDFSLTDRKTGRRITFKELTPAELGKFFAYLGGVLWQAARVRLTKPRGPSVCFLPDRPRPWHVVWSAAALCGARIVPDPQSADALFYFTDTTVGAPLGIAGAYVLNGALLDISKSRVASMFERVAGYALTVDPAAYRGMAVVKSEINGAHDGRLVACPRAAEPGVAYQRFIDSSDGVTAVDYRTIVIDRRPRFVLVKTKPAASRFSIHNTRVEYRAIEDVFSAAERALVAAFAEAMQIDWAALDILRDRDDGQIYVVDVNKTDTGPPVDLSAADREKLKEQIAAGFHALLLKAQLGAALPARDTAA